MVHPCFLLRKYQHASGKRAFINSKRVSHHGAAYKRKKSWVEAVMTFKDLIKRLLPKGRFFRGILALSTATAVGQAIAILTTPVITRLYSPEDFGVLAVYSSYLGIIMIVASLRYELAIPLPRSDGRAANLLVLSLINLAGVAAITGLVVVLFGEQIVRWSNTPYLISYLWLLPLGVFLGGAYQVFNYWAIRKQAFSRLARTKIQQGAGSAVTKIALGLAQSGTIGLILGTIVGQAAGLANLVLGAFREDGAALKRIRLLRVRWSARRYRNFPLYSTWSALANTAGSRLPLVLFSAMFSPVVAGYYMLSDKIIHMPMELIGHSIGQVFHSSAAEARRENYLAEVSIKAFETLVRVGTGPLIVFAVVAPDLFPLVFGFHWRQAGFYVQLLIPMIVLQFVFSPISSLFNVMELQRGNLVFQILLLVARVIGILLGAFQGNIILAIILYSSLSGMVYFFAMAWILSSVGVIFWAWFKILLKEVGISMIFASVLWIIKRAIPLNYDIITFWGNVYLLFITLTLLALLTIWRILPIMRESDVNKE
jgi:O-antigen/teichoic acid export membrane protein